MLAANSDAISENLDKIVTKLLFWDFAVSRWIRNKTLLLTHIHDIFCEIDEEKYARTFIKSYSLFTVYWKVWFDHKNLQGFGKMIVESSLSCEQILLI